MSIKKLVGKKVKVALPFKESGAEMNVGNVGSVISAEDIDGMGFLMIDWTGSTFEGEGWGRNRSMWNIGTEHMHKLRYCNNKALTV